MPERLCSADSGEIRQYYQELLELLCSKAYLEGQFKLSSGRMSRRYFDARQVTMDPRGIYLVARIFFHKLGNLDLKAVGGPPIGADPIAHATALVSEILRPERPFASFIVRKEPKKYGLMSSVEGPVKNGDRVAIVDDTITTGNSVNLAIQRAQEAGLSVVKVMVLIDREEGGAAERFRDYDFEALFTGRQIIPSTQDSR